MVRLPATGSPQVCVPGTCPVSGKAQVELKQTRPFENDGVEAFVNVLRTADWLAREFEKLVGAHRLTGPQYNALRILRGAARTGEGLPCSEIGARMVTRDPDITRLLDRLERRKLLTRARDGHDRRVVNVRISAEGLRILKALDRPVAELHQRQMRVLGKAGTRRLIALLEKLREP